MSPHLSIVEACHSFCVSAEPSICNHSGPNHSSHTSMAWQQGPQLSANPNDLVTGMLKDSPLDRLCCFVRSDGLVHASMPCPFCCQLYTVQQVRKRGSNTVTALRRVLMTAAEPLVHSHTYLPTYQPRNLGTEKRSFGKEGGTYLPSLYPYLG